MLSLGGLRWSGRLTARSQYASTRERTLSPVQAGSVIVLGDGDGSDTVLGKALGAGATRAFLRVFHTLYWLLPLISALLTLSLMLGTAALFEVAELRGWAAGWLIFAAGVPLPFTVIVLARPSVLWALLFRFDAWFLSLTTIGGCLAEAYALDNRFDDRAPFLLGVLLPNLLLALLSDALRQRHRRIAALMAFIGVGTTVSFMVAMCTRPASKIDVDLEVLPSFAWGVSKMALSAATTLTLFLLRMGLVLLLRPAERVILGAPLRMMPASDEEAAADRGEPAFAGLRASAQLPAGTRVLAPGADADVLFDSRATIAQALLSPCLADALWGVYRRIWWLLYTAWGTGILLLMCLVFDLAVSATAVAAASLLSLPLVFLIAACINVQLLWRVSGRFDVLFLVGEVIVAHLSLAAFFKWDLRAVALLCTSLPSTLTVCFIDAWHPSMRQLAWVAISIGLLGTCTVTASVVVAHPALVADAAVLQLGTLRYKVGQLAFDTLRVMGIFFFKNLSIIFFKPARYFQMHSPLLEQVVRDGRREEAEAGIGGGSGAPGEPPAASAGP